MNRELKFLFVEEDINLYNAAIEFVYNELFESYGYSKNDILKDEQTKKGSHIVALYDFNIVGHAKISIKDYKANISQVVVSEEYRDKSIGTLIINNLIDFSKKFNVKYIELNARKSAIVFYEKFGFVKNGELKNSSRTGIPLMSMRKEIKI